MADSTCWSDKAWGAKCVVDDRYQNQSECNQWMTLSALIKHCKQPLLLSLFFCRTLCAELQGGEHVASWPVAVQPTPYHPDEADPRRHNEGPRWRPVIRDSNPPHCHHREVLLCQVGDNAAAERLDGSIEGRARKLYRIIKWVLRKCVAVLNVVPSIMRTLLFNSISSVPCSQGSMVQLQLEVLRSTLFWCF